MLLVCRYTASIEEYYPLAADAPSAERRMIMNISELCVNCKQNNSCTMCWRTSNKKCPHFVQKTNADKIRSMSDFELAKEIENAQSGIEIKNPKNIDYFDCILEWLKQPEEDET